jgi:hypothetical protein
MSGAIKQRATHATVVVVVVVRNIEFDYGGMLYVHIYQGYRERRDFRISRGNGLKVHNGTHIIHDDEFYFFYFI